MFEPSMIPRLCHWLSALLLLLGIIWTTDAADDSLYRLLGVEKSASIQEIKRAYRRKALDTHPDKNPNQEEASLQFRAVVDAFEVLSDPVARKRYDATGTTSTSHARNPFQWHFRRGQTQLKDHYKVKEAKLRVMHVVSMAQLATVILNDEDKLERHLLMCFITPSTESIMEDSILYPFPFAGMSTQGIWWEDVLQTIVVRHHTPNHELVKHFDIPTDIDKPVFVFLKQNATLTPEDSVMLTTSHREDFENWVWKQLEVKVQFRNEHSHAVELYWLHDTRAHLKATILPKQSHYENTMLSHAYVARDARVDQFEGSPGRYKLMPNALVGNWTITSTTPSVVTIPAKPCMDMSGHCSFWSMNPKGECQRNAGFMHKTCALTCNVCSNYGNDETDSLSNNAGRDEL
jgi:hypothetical protein